MIKLSILALCLAILANVVSNLLFKHAMTTVKGETPLQTVLGVLTSIPAWAGFLCAGVLLASYLYAIRTLPLGPSYASVTAMTIALLTAWGMISGTEPLVPVKLVGIAAIIIGFVLITVPFGRQVS